MWLCDHHWNLWANIRYYKHDKDVLGSMDTEFGHWDRQMFKNGFRTLSWTTRVARKYPFGLFGTGEITSTEYETP